MANLQVTDSYAVNSKTLALRIETGKITPGRQETYTQQAGDFINEGVVFREGKAIGQLVDDGQIIRTYDTFSGPDLDENWATQASNYRVSGIKPSRAFVKSKVADSALTEGYKFKFAKEHTIFLEMPEAMEPGKRYSIDFLGNQLEDRSFTFSPQTERSEAVHVSHLGFHPEDPAKVAFLSTWLGPEGKGLSYQEGQTFFLVDEGGNKVYEGKIALSKSQEEAEDKRGRNYNGTDVYIADFSDFKQRGKFKVVVEGVGTSFPFEIGDRTWENAFQVSMEGLYTQRSGIELRPEFSDYSAPRSFHPDDGLKVEQTNAQFSIDGDEAFDTIKRERTGEIVENAWGGWKDAGDWDRNTSHLKVSRQMLELAEMFPDYFSKTNLTIPESNNNIADVIDEALWGVDFFKRLQREDGGIRGGIESASYPNFMEASWQESQEVFAFAPDTQTSYAYAGVAARAAYLLRDIDSGRAREYEESALRAMRWAENKSASNPDRNWITTSERNLAALELFRLTGDQSWHDVFLSNTSLNDRGAPVLVWEDYDHRNAAFVYARLEGEGVDSQIKENARQALTSQAEENLDAIAQTGFKWYKNPYAVIEWGAFADQSDMIRAHYVSGDEKYLEGTILASQFMSGANPDNISYTTGIGPRQPDDVFFQDSLVTGQDTPKGITIYGPVDLQHYDGYGAIDLFRNETDTRLKDWPTTEAFFDVSELYVSTEYTIAETIAPTSYTWGYLAANNATGDRSQLSLPVGSIGTKTPTTLVPGIKDSLIDLRGVDFDGNGELDQQVRAVFNAEAFADYDNTVGFYEVEDRRGTVTDKETDETFTPGDEQYARVALSNRVESLDMNRETGSLMVELESDQILAPFLVADGTPEQALQSPSALQESVLFSYKAENPDGLEYIASQGDNRLKFEDLWGDSDRNFTDFAVDIDLGAV